MKKLLVFFLLLAMFLSACGRTNSKTYSLTPVPTPTTKVHTPTPTPVSRGSQLPVSSLRSTAESYVKGQVGDTTSGGHKITRYVHGETTSLGSDDLYENFKVTGHYNFIDKYGYEQTQSFTMKVRVYKWSLNPDNRTTVHWYY